MSPGDYTYLDHYQGDPATEPLAICCYLPLDTVYAFEPVPAELTPAQAAHVIGAQGNLWGEYIATPKYAEYMLLPRMLALSEVVWSPKAARDWDGFVARLPAQLARLDALGVDYRLPEPLGPWGDHKVLEERTTVTLATPFDGGVIRYTTDGTDPTRTSPRYDGPIGVTVGPTPATVSARLHQPNGRASAVARARFARAEWKQATAVAAGATQPGLAYAYTEGKFTAADDVRRGAATRTGTATVIGMRGDERAEDYGLTFTGFMRVPDDALYTFYLVSDDGAKLRIDDELVVDHDGQHDATEKRGEVALRAGWHRVELTYFQGPGGAVLQVGVSAPGLARRTLPAEWLANTGDARR
jgi:hexosaminidase